MFCIIFLFYFECNEQVLRSCHLNDTIKQVSRFLRSTTGQFKIFYKQNLFEIIEMMTLDQDYED